MKITVYECMTCASCAWEPVMLCMPVRPPPRDRSEQPILFAFLALFGICKDRTIHTTANSRGEKGDKTATYNRPIGACICFGDTFPDDACSRDAIFIFQAAPGEMESAHCRPSHSLFGHEFLPGPRATMPLSEPLDPFVCAGEISRLSTPM